MLKCYPDVGKSCRVISLDAFAVPNTRRLKLKNVYDHMPYNPQQNMLKSTHSYA